MWFSQKERMVSQAPFFRGELLVLGRQLTWRIGSEGNTKVKESRKSQSFEDARHKIWGLTLPKTNISPEKWWLEDYIPWLYSVYSWQNAWCLSCPKPPGLIATVHHGSHQARGPYLVEACCSNEKHQRHGKKLLSLTGRTTVRYYIFTIYLIQSNLYCMYILLIKKTLHSPTPISICFQDCYRKWRLFSNLLRSIDRLDSDRLDSKNRRTDFSCRCLSF